MSSSINGVESPTSFEELLPFLNRQIEQFQGLLEQDEDGEYSEFNEGALEGLSIAHIAVQDILQVPYSPPKVRDYVDGLELVASVIVNGELVTTRLTPDEVAKTERTISDDQGYVALLIDGYTFIVQSVDLEWS